MCSYSLIKSENVYPIKPMPVTQLWCFLPRKTLRKSVRQHVVGAAKFDFDLLCFDGFANEVVPDIDVFGPCMMHRVFA